MLIIKEVELYIVNKNLFDFKNIFVYNLCFHVIFFLQDMLVNITL